MSYIEKEGIYTPTAKEKELVFASDIIEKALKFRCGGFDENGKHYFGYLVAHERKNGEIWYHYWADEESPHINIFEPDVECRMIADFGTADENGNKPTNPYGALPRTEFISA